MTTDAKNRFRLYDVSDLRTLALVLPFNLQRFAAEDEGRTEEPTEKKIREAREKGQVAKTAELPSSLVVIFGFLVLFFIGTWIWDTLARMTVFYLTNFSRFSITESSVLQELFRSLEVLGKTLLPVFVAVIVAAILGNVAQVGFQFSTHPLKVDFSKMKFNPAEILKKILFSPQVAMNLVKSLVKVTAIAFIAYLIIVSDFSDIERLPDISIAHAMVIVSSSAIKIIIWSSVVILVLAVPDYFFQKREFIESLKMTKEELKQELKESQGDPHIRARLRQLQRELLMRNMVREVPKADVVVTNPTHYAVALRFEREKMASPMVIAKGVDAIALRIREIAKEHDVMMIENRPLAQELYRRLDVGDFIPEDLYKAVSLVYAELYRTRDLRAAI
jgi:flagellar biosynthetic protein FlhB